MVRVVFDTNILLSAFLFGGKPEQLFELVRSRKIRLLTSPSILAEFASCLKVKFNWEYGEIVDAIRTIGYSAELIKPVAKITILSDDADNRIFECAFEGKADYIVSWDRHLLELKKFQKIPIVKAAEFFETLPNFPQIHYYFKRQFFKRLQIK